MARPWWLNVVWFAATRPHRASHRAPGPLAMDLPRVGRYRLYDLLPQGRVRCRLCGAGLLLDHAWRHAFCVHGPTDTLAMLESIRFLLLRRRSDRHRRHSQYEKATKGAPWE